MQKYNENPWWWYAILLFLAFIAGKNHLHFFIGRIFAEFIYLFRFDCCLQGTDHPSLVVIHRRSTHGRIYHCKFIFRKTKKKETVYIHAMIFAAFLDYPLCTHGQWSRYDPIDEDDGRCH